MKAIVQTLTVFTSIVAMFQLACVDGERNNPYDMGGSNWNQPRAYYISHTPFVYKDTGIIYCHAESFNGPIARYRWGFDSDTFTTATRDSFVYRCYKDTNRHTVRVMVVDSLGIASNQSETYFYVQTGRPGIAAMWRDTVGLFDTVSIIAPGYDSNGTVVKYIWALDGYQYLDTTTSDNIKTVMISEGWHVVRVKAVDDDGFESLPQQTSIRVVTIGEPFFFPENNASIVRAKTVLRWQSNPFYNRFELFFGTDTNTWKKVDSSLTDTFFNCPNRLESGRRYCWRIICYKDTLRLFKGGVHWFSARAPEGMVLVDSGSFQMGQTDPNIGCDSCSTDESPVRNVFVSPFWMDKTEITFKQMTEVVGVKTGHMTLGWDWCSGDSCPAHQITWFEAVVYCNAKSRLDGLDSVYGYTAIVLGNNGEISDLTDFSFNPDNNGYRLPTEAEWEYAYRAWSSNTPYYWGSSEDTAIVNRYAWYFYNAHMYIYITGMSRLGGTKGVGQKAPNGLNLFDMAGNVWEWCHDWYGPYAVQDTANPMGPSLGSEKVLRGGDFTSPQRDLRGTKRGRFRPGGLAPFDGVGARLVLPTN